MSRLDMVRKRQIPSSFALFRVGSGDCAVNVAVFNSGVPGRVVVSWNFHQRDVVAESRRLSHGPQSSDTDT